MRVCRPGGKIGLANWTPDSFIGKLFRTMGQYVPPPAGVKSPSLWGNQGASRRPCSARRRRSRRRAGTSCSATSRRSTGSRSSATYYGPVLKAFAALDQVSRDALEADIYALLDAVNVAKDGTLVVPSEYLEVVITCR